MVYCVASVAKKKSMTYDRRSGMFSMEARKNMLRIEGGVTMLSCGRRTSPFNSWLLTRKGGILGG